MGTIQKGILGGFSGKVGTVVGANWRGQDVMRSLPKKSDRAATEEQLIIRERFKLVTRFLAPIRPILALYFGQPQGYKSRRNLATSYHLTDAVIGVMPNLTIDYPKVIITKGELLLGENLAATAGANARIDVSWQDNSGEGLAKADDQLLAVVYNPDRDRFHTLMAGAARDEGTFRVELPPTWAAETVHCWLSFASAEGKKVANSVYMGELNLP